MRVEFLNQTVEREYFRQPAEVQARLQQYIRQVEVEGLDSLPPKITRYLADGLWEFRIRGRNTTARALYVIELEDRLIIVSIFTKKFQKTPLKEIRLARERAKEIHR